MNGMHQEENWAYTIDSDNFTASHDYELPPTPTLAQITLGQFYEFGDQSHVDLGFTSCAYLDEHGVTRTDLFPDIDDLDSVHVFARNGLARADFQIRVSNMFASYVVNFFFWDEVS
jgi:hypothetical protein